MHSLVSLGAPINEVMAMPSAQKLDTHHKALAINLDTSTFGSFAEIGAGQEVARWFLLVGGASGTVAKTISAYDKKSAMISTAPVRATSPNSDSRRCWTTNGPNFSRN
jgi:hypothetical protein